MYKVVRYAGRVRRVLALRRMEGVADVQARNPGFATVRDDIRRAGTDSMSHFQNGYTHEGGLSLQQNPDEFAALCLFLKERGPYKQYLEIGSGSGGACRFLQTVVDLGSVISLDDGNHPRAGEQPANFAHVPNFRQHLGDSHAADARNYLTQTLAGQKLDLAFIDGDHSYEGVRQDIELTMPFCRRGGLVVFHDTVACIEVRLAWLRAVDEWKLRPVAEFVGSDRPLGISVNVAC